jgi:hypothetical protein
MLKIKHNKTSKTNKPPAKKSGPLDRAKAAVTMYEKLREELNEKQAAFEEDHPDAAAALRDIRETEDSVRTAIEQAKPLVREAGQSVGDFRLQQSFRQPGYDPKKLMDVVGNTDSPGDLLNDLTEAGLVLGFIIDRDVAKVIKTARPDLAEIIDSAWDAGGEPLTGAVFTPKL